MVAEPSNKPIEVPDVTGLSTLDAAHAYAAAGWYVVPTSPSNIKNPGSVVGGKWPEQSSRAPGDIEAWWNPDMGGDASRGIALHVGKSGAVAFDVDNPDALPSWLNESFGASRSPLQVTQTSNGSDADVQSDYRHPRGHRLFLMPKDMPLGNSIPQTLVDTSNKAWGDVRGLGGVIIVAPTPHPRASQGGTYEWVRTGPLRPLPEPVRAAYVKAGVSAPDTKADLDTGALGAFLASLPTGTPSTPVQNSLVSALQALAGSPGGRHDALNRAVLDLVRKGQEGHPGVREALAALRQAYLGVITGRDAEGEWIRGLEGAIGTVAHSPTLPAGVDLMPADQRTDYLDRLSRGEVSTTAANPPATSSLILPGSDEYDLLVEREYLLLKAREEARRRVRAEGVSSPPIESEPLAKLLATEDIEVAYRVDQLWPIQGKILVAAQAKAGKTTLMGNMVKSLVDETTFIGRFDASSLEGKRVALLDNEMSKAQLQRWYRCFNIQNVDAIEMFYMRGKLSRFNILDDKVRSDWAARLRESGIGLVIFDCVRPALDALGLDEHKDAGVFLVALEALLAEAGIDEMAVVHHMGHGGERSRGDSRLVDWPDATWKLVLEDPEDKRSDRYFSAYGRDVDVEEDQLWYDSLTHHLTLAGTGSRKQAKAQSTKDSDDHLDTEMGGFIVGALKLHPNGLSKNQLEKEVYGDNNRKRRIIRDMIEEGALTQWTQGRAIMVKLPGK